MSYARYFWTPFYVYPVSSTVVNVNCDHDFTAEQLEQDMDGCIDKVLATPISNPLNPGYGKPKAELAEELKAYLTMFLKDPWRKDYGE